MAGPNNHPNRRRLRTTESARKRGEALEQFAVKLKGPTPEQTAARLAERMAEPIEETARKARQQLVQGAEAVAEFLRRYPEETEDDLPPRFLHYELLSC